MRSWCKIDSVSWRPRQDHELVCAPAVGSAATTGSLRTKAACIVRQVGRCYIRSGRKGKDEPGGSYGARGRLCVCRMCIVSCTGVVSSTPWNCEILRCMTSK
jgi:hypothetical protein